MKTLFFATFFVSIFLLSSCEKEKDLFHSNCAYEKYAGTVTVLDIDTTSEETINISFAFKLSESSDRETYIYEDVSDTLDYIYSTYSSEILEGNEYEAYRMETESTDCEEVKFVIPALKTQKKKSCQH